jgi:hypothetical protein
MEDKAVKDRNTRCRGHVCCPQTIVVAMRQQKARARYAKTREKAANVAMPSNADRCSCMMGGGTPALTTPTTL